MIIRILVGTLLLFSILFLPLWVSVIVAFLAMVYFPIYVEAAIMFLISDLVYGASEAKFSGMVFVSFLTFLIAVFILEIFKKRIKFYS